MRRMTATNTAPTLEEYEAALDHARREFDTADAVRFGFGDEKVDAADYAFFMLYFCGVGYQMTKNVENWIRRAGERCTAIGLSALGRNLVSHSKHEAGHEILMANDARYFAARCRVDYGSTIEFENILSLSSLPGVQAYIDLHENVIAGTTPQAQVAIEYEIEMLSVRHGPSFIAKTLEVLGPSAKNGLSFVNDHVELDVGHTNFNRRQMAALLQEAPQSYAALCTAGQEALRAYGMFLRDCLILARSTR